MHRSEFCQISGDWSNLELRDTKFGANVSNKKWLNAEKYQGYSFYCFWITRGKPKKRGEGKITPLPLPPTHTHTHTQIIG